MMNACKMILLSVKLTSNNETIWDNLNMVWASVHKTLIRDQNLRPATNNEYWANVKTYGEDRHVTTATLDLKS